MTTVKMTRMDVRALYEALSESFAEQLTEAWKPFFVREMNHVTRLPPLKDAPCQLLDVEPAFKNSNS